MVCIDFIIRKENTFLRNICPEELLENNLGTLEQYHKVSQKFIKIFVLLNRKYKNEKKHKWEGIEDQIVKDACREDCVEYDNLQNLFSAIDEFKIKKYQNVSKSSMQVLAFA